MLRTIHLLFTFYKVFWLPSQLVNAFCWAMVYMEGTGPLFILILFKLFTAALIVAYVHEYSESHYYYYHNLGLSRAILWGATLGFDFVFLITGIILLCIR